MAQTKGMKMRIVRTGTDELFYFVLCIGFGFGATGQRIRNLCGFVGVDESYRGGTGKVVSVLKRAETLGQVWLVVFFRVGWCSSA